MTGASEARSRWRRWAPWIWTGVVAAVALGALVFADLPEGDPFSVLLVLLSPVFAALGAIVTTRAQGNVIGWILSFIGSAVVIGIVMSALVPETAPDSLTVPLLLLLDLDGVQWMSFIFPVFLILFLFPTGQFLSPRWRWAGWLMGAMTVSLVVLGAFTETVGPSSEAWVVDNPYGFVPDSFFDGPFQLVWNPGLLALALGGLVAMVVRYRRASAVERTQIKWVLLASIVFGISFAASVPLSDSTLSSALFGIFFAAAFACIPLSITIAITRYRLYAIDRLLSRTITYGLVVGVMVAVYSVAVAALSLVIPERTDLGVAVATLVAVVVSVPLVQRVRRWVDKRFFRSRYDAAEVVAAFASDLRQTLGTDAVVALTVAVVAGAFAPESVDVWLDGGPV
jgi:hypothetical protein